MTREAKLVGFVVLLIAVFLVAHLAGSHLGPVQGGHAHVSGPGTGGTTMNMGAGG